MFEYKGLKISWLGHDCFKIKDRRTIYIDPYRIRGGERADIILITHEHFDHLSPEDISKIVSPDSVIVAAAICRSGLSSMKPKELKLVRAGESIEALGVKVEAAVAYNVNKFRAPGKVFHPKDYGGVGFIMELDGVRVYHAGDTDHIPEMKSLKVDVALIPVSGVYVMTAEEAARAVADIGPKVAIPMHFGTIVGGRRDAERFEQLAKCEVHILEKE